MSRSKQHDRNRRAIQRQVGMDFEKGPIMRGKSMQHPAAVDSRAFQQARKAALPGKSQFGLNEYLNAMQTYEEAHQLS